MAADFSELLSANRLRRLWDRGTPSPTPALAESGSPRPEADALLDRDAKAVPRAAANQEELGAAPPEPVPAQTPVQILDQVERLLGQKLGRQAMLLQVYLQPLRQALAGLAGNPSLAPPAVSAQLRGNLTRLTYGLEDALCGLLRARQRPGT